MSSGSSRMPNAGGGDVPAPDWMMQTGGLPRHASQIRNTGQAGLSLPQIASRQDGYNPNLTPPDPSLAMGGPGGGGLSLPGANEMQQQQTAPQSSPLLAALLSGDERKIAGSIRDWHGGVGETLRAIAARQ